MLAALIIVFREVLEAGIISGGGDAASMAADSHVREAYLGA